MRNVSLALAIVLTVGIGFWAVASADDPHSSAVVAQPAPTSSPSPSTASAGPATSAAGSSSSSGLAGSGSAGSGSGVAGAAAGGATAAPVPTPLSIAEGHGACQSRGSLRVAAATGVVTVLRTVAADSCINLVITVADGTSGAKLLAAGKVDAWVPDSTENAIVAVPDISVLPSIARSPVVMAADPFTAKIIMGRAGPLTWASLLQQKALAPLTVQIQNPADSGVRLALAGQLGKLAGVLVGNRETGVAAAAQALTTITPMTQAQAVSAAPPTELRIEEARFLAGSGAALVPTKEGVPVLDYPWVERPGGTPASKLLRSALAGPLGTAARAAAGLYEPGASVVKIAGTSLRLLPHLDDALVRTSYAMTGTGSIRDNVLSVVDVSGSMSENTDGHGAAIDAVHASATPMIGILPKGSSVGLWVFGNQLAAPVDYKEIVPMAPLTVNSAQMLAGVAAIRAQKTGTALYRTVLAAYQHVQQQYDPHGNNIVAIFTDGRNQDVTGLDLPGLVQQLNAAKDPAKPVQLLFFGFGDADATAMQTIVDAVGTGGVWTITSKEQIIGGMLEAAGQSIKFG